MSKRVTKSRLNVSITALSMICVASIFFLVGKMSVNRSSTLEQMLSEQDIAQINQYRDLFNIESEPVLVAIQTPGHLPASTIAAIEKALLSLPNVSNTLSSVSFGQFGIARKQLFSLTANTELILLMISPGAQQLQEAGILSQEIRQTVNALLQAGESVFIAGMPQIRAASWQITSRDMNVILPLLVLITLVVTLLLFNSYTALLLSLLLTSLTTVICLALQLLVRAEIDALMVAVVPVIWAIATLDAFHLYSRTAIKTKRKDPNPARAASQEIFVPCLLTTVTTAGCFMTLTVLGTSPLIVSFGVWGTVGAVVAFVLTFTLGEKLLSMTAISDGCPRWPSLVAFNFVRFTQQHYVATVLVWGAVTLLAILYIPRIEIATTFPQVFTYDQNIAQEINYLKDLTGSDLNPVDIIIEANDLYGENDERTASAALLSNNYLNTIKETRLVLPIGVMDEEMLESLSGRWEDKGYNPEGKTADVVSQLANWFNQDRHAVRLQAYMAETSYKRKQEIFSWLTHFGKTMLGHHKITLSGSGYFYYLTEKRGLNSLLSSSILSVLIISLTMLWITRQYVQALIALCGCIIPAIIVAGCMAAFNISWSIAMLPMPALLLGLMNDDTIHILWSANKNRRLKSRYFRRNAIMAGPALLATTLVLSGAIATLSFSGIQTNQYLGLLIPLGLLLAFFCNLTLLPALSFCLHKSTLSRR